MFQKKPSASEVDGVQYRRAKTWQIICYACNAFVGMSVYSLIGMASYSASIGYGITTATVGIILMLARILDGLDLIRLFYHPIAFIRNMDIIQFLNRLPDTTSRAYFRMIWMTHRKER